MTGFLDIVEGGSPLILSMPHAGCELVPEVEECLNSDGLAIADTDWWMERLYDFHGDLDASVLATRLSRHVIDVNRDPSGASLYPGRATTDLCPTTTFDGAPLYRDGRAPDEAEIARRVAAYFTPYHDALGALIRRAVERHGYALLYDCHSIRSRVPRLFEGRLPVFNIGTNGGASCHPVLQDIVADACAGARDLDVAVNGRFKGGWITRRYGAPAEGVHAVQMELAQSAYMLEAPPWTYGQGRVDDVRRVLKTALGGMIDWSAHHLGGKP